MHVPLTCEKQEKSWVGVLGKPHVHLWAAVVTYVVEKGKILEDEKQVLRQHLSESEPKQLEETVFVAKFKKCYDPKKMRFVFCTAQQVDLVGSFLLFQVSPLAV